MKRLTKILRAAALVGMLCLPAAHAQQQQQQPPPDQTQQTPPARPGANGQGADQPPVSPVAGTTPTVTGGLAAGVGETTDTHSHILLGFQVSELLDTNVNNAGVTPGVDEITNFGAHFDLHHMRANSDFMLRYTGGGLIDVRNSQFNSMYHQFEVAQTIRFRRWSLQLGDLFSLLPEALFGFEGGGPEGSTLLGITLLNPNVPPSQGIVTPTGQRISNSVIAQVQVNSSQRVAWTFTGTYGLLHFTDPGYLNSAQYAFGAGFNYQLTRRDTLGVSYEFNAIRFSPVPASINQNIVMFTIGHHITDRLNFQAGVGPDINNYVPVGGVSSGSTVIIEANASINYQYNKTTLTGTFNRGISGGAGVLAGSLITSMEFSAARQVSRWWTIQGLAGYSRNQTLANATGLPGAFDAVNLGGGFTRKIGRRASFFANYNYLHQVSSGAAVCGLVACPGQLARHQGWIGLSWDMRPIGIN